jgi:protein-tyrosine phosphatase
VIDTHCHLLPGLDDGPATVDDAVELAAVLVEQGVEHVVCTPHLSARYPTEHRHAREALGRLRRELETRRLPLTLELAAEVADATAVSAPLADLRRWAIRGRALVVEIGVTMPPVFLDTVTSRLATAGLVPVLAHPERSRVVQREPALLDRARRRGAVVQLVAPSLAGRWGEAVEAAAWRIAETGRADLLGSDAHGIARRRSHLAHVVALLRERLGEEAVTTLLARGPARLLEPDELSAQR